MIFLRSLAIWLVIILAEILHGTARRIWLEPLVGDFTARQIAVFTGSVIILTIAIIFIGWINAKRMIQLLGVGFFWLVLTLGFEISFGRLAGYSWERIGSDYNLFKGGLLPIGLLILTLSPLIAAKVRNAKK